MAYPKGIPSGCNAHLLRELEAIEENIELTWAKDVKKLLLKAKEFKDQNDLPLKRANYYKNKYEKILREERTYYADIDKTLRALKPKGPLKRSVDHNLFRALWKYREGVLKFMFHPDVPFDNNQGERDLRMLKIKMKISNQFKSLAWLNVHLTIRSFISTAQKQNLGILHCLIETHKNPSFAVKVGV